MDCLHYSSHTTQLRTCVHTATVARRAVRCSGAANSVIAQAVAAHISDREQCHARTVSASVHSRSQRSIAAALVPLTPHCTHCAHKLAVQPTVRNCSVRTSEHALTIIRQHRYGTLSTVHCNTQPATLTTLQLPSFTHLPHATSSPSLTLRHALQKSILPSHTVFL